MVFDFKARAANCSHCYLGRREMQCIVIHCGNVQALMIVWSLTQEVANLNCLLSCPLDSVKYQSYFDGSVVLFRHSVKAEQSKPHANKFYYI